MKLVLAFSVILGAVLLYLLSKASANTAAFAQNYTLLLLLNGLLVCFLLVIIGYQLLRLRRKLKARFFGARLTVRMLWMFAVMGILPGVLVYGVSVQFLTRSIESWFDVRVDNALAGGLSLGHTALDHLLQDLNKKGEAMALTLGDLPLSLQINALNNLREQAGVQEASLFQSRGKLVAFSSSEQKKLIPDIPGSSVLRKIRQQQVVSELESIPDKGLYLRVVLPVNVLSLEEDIRVLQLLQPVPRELARDAETVQAVYSDYQELSFSRSGLTKIYWLTLTLTLLLALLIAIALAFVLSERLSAPLDLLGEGTKAIAKGDFTRMHPVQSRDELGILTRSFNRMTRQLAEARESAEFHQQQLQTSKNYLESILAHLSSGVMTFDKQFYLRTANLEANHILGVDLSNVRRIKLSDWGAREPVLSTFANTICEQFQSERGKSKEWQQQISGPGATANQVLLVRGTYLPEQTENGYVVVFDDITYLMQAQRDAAWAEVARRLAHEIKNPLTPIQLSAERLEHKLVAKLEDADAEILRRSISTIVNQVDALKSMVNAFSEYARSPQLQLQPLDINGLIREVVSLYEQTKVNLVLDLAGDLPPINGDMTLLRQVMHNLLQNAFDALTEVEHPQVIVKTERMESWVNLSIQDNGSGFPEGLMARLFEPYVTTKQKGTGLGLAVVKKLIEEHRGIINIENVSPHGAHIKVRLPIVETT